MMSLLMPQSRHQGLFVNQSITDLPLALLLQSVGLGPKWARREIQSPNEENKEAETKTESPRSEELKANVGIVSV